jgi:DNA polymerase-4
MISPASHRKIIHLDLDAFYCAVEELDDPNLVGKPFAVGGRPESRGVVSSCSYAARQLGIRSAMPMARALRLCPSLIIVRPRHDLYAQYSHRVMEYLRNLSPLVEQISIDEAFLDVSDLPESVEEIARNLQERIMTELRLPCSLGIATNKLIAKTATDYGKSLARGTGPPMAVMVVPPGEEEKFLTPLPVQALWGIGPKSTDRLKAIGVFTIGDLARLSDKELTAMFGKNGKELATRSRGIDDRPVVTEHAPKSISQEITFSRDINDPKVLRKVILEQSERVGRQLRESKIAGTTIRLKLRWPDFTTISRQTTLSQPTNLDSDISTAAVQLFSRVWKPGQAVRLIGVAVTGLGATPRQLSLWDERYQKEKRLLDAVDHLHQRFGDRSISHTMEKKPDRNE